MTGDLGIQTHCARRTPNGALLASLISSVSPTLDGLRYGASSESAHAAPVVKPRELAGFPFWR